MEIKSICKKVFDDRTIKLNEKKSTLFIDNAKGATVVHVDGCAISDNGLKCDYLVITPNGVEIYVELKGKDVKHAAEQIKRTIDLLSVDKVRQQKQSYIIASKCPPGLTTFKQIQKSLFKKRYNSSFEIKTVEHRIKI
ncbi:MAG: hypothetical protein WBG43_06155 [Marinifilaceae bacterium]